VAATLAQVQAAYLARDDTGAAVVKMDVAAPGNHDGDFREIRLQDSSLTAQQRTNFVAYFDTILADLQALPPAYE
jgi:hypothetical protein